MNDLVDFLKSLIMTTVQIDKKYRETIPGVISTLKTLVESSDEGTKSKKRKPKKMKLSKTGLYPHEENQVRRWWVANRPETTDDEVSISPAQMKSHVDLLRTRETQLQMILILEILALEPSRAREDDGESQLPGFGEDTQASKTTGAQPTKKRNKHNLPVLIEIHADRLCIWQSTASDEFRLLEDSQVATHPAQGQAAPKASADPLRDFCTDIIMPFFAQRLPELCDSINRKLGGPVIMPPPKPTQAKPSSSKHEAAKPGAATKRPAPPTRSKTIERALYKEQSRRSVSRGPGSTIALMRSATSAAIPGFKREASESSVLRDMAKAEPDELGERPRMLSRSSSLNAKEDNRAQKKAQVDAELKDAISALRRPNRELAGKSIVEAAERRTSGGLSHTRSKSRFAPQSSSSTLTREQNPRSQRGTLYSRVSKSKLHQRTTASAMHWRRNPPRAHWNHLSYHPRVRPSFQELCDVVLLATFSVFCPRLLSKKHPRKHPLTNALSAPMNLHCPLRHHS